MRYAIYFMPGPTAPLTREAARWLGRDIFTGETYSGEATGRLHARRIDELTATARRYGFHATLKAPFRLAADETEASLFSAFEAFAAATESFIVPEMVVGNLDGFFAVVPQSRSGQLDDFSARIVSNFERFRAPLTEADIARRNPERLSPAELQNLHDWGYPHVFESFRFHMTLTDRVPAEERAEIGAILNQRFAPVLPRPFPIDGLALVVEPEPGAPFQVRSHVTLGSSADRKTA